MFGFSKTFVIVIFIAAFFSLGMRDYWIGLQIIGWFAVIKIMWNILRK